MRKVFTFSTLGPVSSQFRRSEEVREIHGRSIWKWEIKVVIQWVKRQFYISYDSMGNGRCERELRKTYGVSSAH